MNTREAERLRNGNELGRGGGKVKAVTKILPQLAGIERLNCPRQFKIMLGA